jgi:2-hydroxylaminobenzoate mutase
MNGGTKMLPSGEHKAEALTLIQRVLDFIGDRPLDKELEFQLNRRFGPYGGLYERLAELLSAGVDEGWVAYAPIEGAGYNRGRIAAPCRDTAGMSVESGLMRNVRGQYHRHTRGEIDMVIPIDDGSQWCGHGAGWVVYPPGSEHFPTVSGGKALVMFFLPNGEIEYMDPPAELATNALYTNASLPRLGSGQRLSKNPHRLIQG